MVISKQGGIPTILAWHVPVAHLITNVRFAICGLTTYGQKQVAGGRRSAANATNLHPTLITR